MNSPMSSVSAIALDVNARLRGSARTARRQILRADARGRDGGLRPRVGGGSGRDENARVEAVIPNNSLAESNKSDSPVLINSPA